MSLGLLSADPILLRELTALGSVIDYYDAQLGQSESRPARWLLGDPKPEVVTLHRVLSETNYNLTKDAEAFDPSSFAPERITALLHDGFRDFDELLADYLGRSSAPKTEGVAASNAEQGSPLDRFIDALRPPPKKPPSTDVLPLRLYYACLRIQCLQHARREKVQEYVLSAASGDHENLGLELRRFTADLEQLASATVGIRSADGISGPLPIHDPYPEERRFCAEMISRLESRALSLGKRQLVDVATVEQLRDRIERMRLVRQVERETHPPAAAAPQPSEGERLIGDLVRVAQTLRQFDEEAERIVNEFPELQKEIERKRREVLDRLRDAQ